MISGRDFIFDYIVNEEQDGTIIITTSSNLDLNDSIPVPKGIVRGNSPIGGYIIKPKNEDRTESHVKLLLELNFGGNIPDFAVKTAFRDQGYILDKLRKIMPEYYKKYDLNK